MITKSTDILRHTYLKMNSTGKYEKVVYVKQQVNPRSLHSSMMYSIGMQSILKNEHISIGSIHQCTSTSISTSVKKYSYTQIQSVKEGGNSGSTLMHPRFHYFHK